MIWWFFISLLLSGLIAWLTGKFLIPRAIIWLGNQDIWWSPVRVLPPPGEMFILVKGDPDGPFDQVIESVVGHEYNPSSNTFGPVTSRDKEDYLAEFGVEWVGFWKYFLWREVRYDKYEMTLDGAGRPTGEMGLVPKVRGRKGHEGDSPSIFFRYNMATEVKGAETVGNFPVDAVIVFTAEVHNPAQAFFFAGGWETQTTAAIQGVVREYIGTKTVDKLRAEVRSGQQGNNPLVGRIKDLTDGLPGRADGLEELFGIRIVDARFVSFDLVTGDQKMTDAVRAKEVAKLNAAAAKLRGKGERDERAARAEGVRKEVAAWASSYLGGQIAMAEAIKVAKPNVIGAGVVVSVDDKPRVTET